MARNATDVGLAVLRLVEVLEPGDEARGVPPAAAQLLDLGVELVDQRGHRKGSAVAAGFVEADAQILAHPVGGEAEVELALDHGLVTVLHLPGAGGTLRDHLHHGLHVEARLHAEVDGFGEALHEARDGDLVDHLGELARAREAEQFAHAGEMRDQRLGLRIILRIAAAHDGEHAVLGTRLAARDGRINETEALGLRDGMKLTGDGGGGGRMIDEDGAGFHRLEGAVRAGRDLAEIVVVADACEDEIGVLRGFGGGWCRRPLEGVGPFRGLGGGAVINRDRKPAPRDEMTRHRIAHHAETDPRHTHSTLPLQ